MDSDALGLPPGAFAKLDAEDDEFFYEPARLVCHIDDGAIAASDRNSTARSCRPAACCSI